VTTEAVVLDFEGWDSTTHVGLILELEEALGIEFDVERVSSFENVGELIDECER
jgi:acyl carrier protein